VNVTPSRCSINQKVERSRRRPALGYDRFRRERLLANDFAKPYFAMQNGARPHPAVTFGAGACMQEQFRTGAETSAGEEAGVSRWIAVSQTMIDDFADLTGDDQFIHVDPERARRETPLGGTVAHGFLTLSLLGAMAREVQPPDGAAMSLDCGFDRIRFISPVRAGSRIRGRFVLSAIEERAPGEATLHWQVIVEIEGRERPALVADWISRRYFAGLPEWSEVRCGNR
jgi:acyl dehydratase